MGGVVDGAVWCTCAGACGVLCVHAEFGVMHHTHYPIHTHSPISLSTRSPIPLSTRSPIPLSAHSPIPSIHTLPKPPQQPDDLGFGVLDDDDLGLAPIYIDRSGASLTDRVSRVESAETRRLRQQWEIPTEEIDLDIGPGGERVPLGAGGFGEVYQGMWNGATPVAVKFIIPHILKEEHVRNLYKEINVLKECRHTNIVQFYGACLQVRGDWAWCVGVEGYVY